MKKIYGLVVVVLGLLAAPLAAHAASATVSWTNPTAYTNGTPIPTGTLTGTRVEWGTCSGTNVFGSNVGETVVAAPATSAVVSGLADGTTFCFRAYARTASAESAASNVASKATPPLVPNPPVLSSTITVAYSLVVGKSGVRLGKAVGTIPLGTPCVDNPIWTNKGEYYEVPGSSVSPPATSLVVTKCAWI